MESIVALDIETTGLDPQSDAIIEIGAVRFKGHRLEGEWKALINPGRPIPPFITQLTGITDQMVRDQPPLRSVLPDFAKFVGNAPVLGHNVRFDLSFLRQYKILGYNDAIDTYDLASVLLPGAGRYSLSALAQALGIPVQEKHRGYSDAHTTWLLFLKLYDELAQLPADLLAEIVRLSEPVEWGAYWALKEALRSRSKEVVPSRPDGHAFQGPLFSEKPGRGIAPLLPIEHPVALDPAEVAAVLEHGGAFSAHFPHYEYRPQQVEMLKVVTDALCSGRHLLVEAGTGTGKSIAYLIPAALYAIRNNLRVVISTNTINLQDQLINKDIPDLQAALGIDLRAVVIKGRSNYLCPRRLEGLRRRGPETADEMRILAKVLVWLQGTQTGDRAELNINGPVEREIWARISAEDEGCTTENCLRRTGGNCPFHRTRQAAQNAHLLIVNHALLLADVATGNRVLPDYDYLIVDEAHHLEDAVTNALSYRVTQGDIERLLRELGGPNSGALGWLLSATQEILSPDEYASLNYLVQRTTDLAFRFDNLAAQFFYGVSQFLGEQREGRPMGMYTQQERILSSTRTLPAWSNVEFAWEETELVLRSLLEHLARLVQGLSEVLDGLAEEDEELFGLASNIYRRALEFHDIMDALVFKPDESQVYWAEVQPSGYRVALNAAPLHIGPLMQKFLWNEKTSVILTSATLTAAGEFEYLRSRLFAEDADELALGSPFDFEGSTLLYLVNDIPEPNDRHGHQRGVESGLINLCRATGGRALVLFTSYDQLKRTSQAIAPVLIRDDILVFEQGEGASAHSLLETFRSSERAVLLGTRAFWEGVDVPGEALSLLVIVKLPFDVPSDPIIAARAETFEDSFYQYSLPEAILRFRQGFGRLIRTQFDRGVVAILDRRIISKRYGQAFIDSLPTCTVRVGPLSNLPRAAAKWLNL